jgi:hypothetical protein
MSGPTTPRRSQNVTDEWVRTPLPAQDRRPELVAIDRPLDERQLGEVRTLLTRARITPTSFVNTYEWGNFRGNPSVLMERYYDALLYLTNWGTRWLSFRVPSRLLDLPTAQRYRVGMRRAPASAVGPW